MCEDPVFLVDSARYDLRTFARNLRNRCSSRSSSCSIRLSNASPRSSGTCRGMPPAGQRTASPSQESRRGDRFKDDRRNSTPSSKACKESTPDDVSRIGFRSKPSMRTSHCHSSELTLRGMPSETMMRLLGSSASLSSRLAIVWPTLALDILSLRPPSRGTYHHKSLASVARFGATRASTLAWLLDLERALSEFFTKGRRHLERNIACRTRDAVVRPRQATL